MNKIKLSLTIITALLFIAVLIEVINPHSFLSTDGAFARVVALLVGAACWYLFFKNTQSKLVITGIVILFIAAMLYFFYGVSSFCQNKYYETYKDAIITPLTDIAPYNCSRIIRDSLFLQ